MMTDAGYMIKNIMKWYRILSLRKIIMNSDVVFREENIEKDKNNKNFNMLYFTGSCMYVWGSIYQDT